MNRIKNNISIVITLDKINANQQQGCTQTTISFKLFVKALQMLGVHFIRPGCICYIKKKTIHLEAPFKKQKMSIKYKRINIAKFYFC